MYPSATDNSLIGCRLPEDEEHAVGKDADSQRVSFLVENEFHHEVFIRGVSSHGNMVRKWYTVSHSDGLDRLGVHGNGCQAADSYDKCSLYDVHI